MGTENQAADDGDEPLDLTEDMELGAEGQGDDDQGDEGDDGEGEEGPAVVSFEGEEPDPEPDNSTIRQMRQELRETKRKLADMEKRAAPAPIEVGPKPTMESCNFDEDEFETQLDSWKERKAAADRQTEQQQEQARKANEDWSNDVAAFETKKAAVAADFEDAVEAIESATLGLDLVQQAVVVKSADNPALFLYALSKSPAKAAELAKINDPIKLAAAVARMEGAVKVTKTKKAPDPDRPLTGSGKMPGSPDKELEKLEKEAIRTGDRTKLQQYKRSKGIK